MRATHARPPSAKQRTLPNTDELVVGATYAGAPDSPVDMSSDDRLQVEDVGTQVDCSQPMTQPDPLFCPEGAYQRAMLKQYVTHTNVARCGGRIDATSAASFAPLSVQWVQRVSPPSDAWVVVPTPGAVTTSGGVPVDIEGQHGGESATRGTLLGSRGERPARPVQVDSTHCSTKPPAPLHPATIAKLQFRPGLQEDIEIATRLKQWWVQSLGGLLIDLLW
eukprot:jgi/Tetstr1/433332/TSEL_022618.t1